MLAEPTWPLAGCHVAAAIGRDLNAADHAAARIGRCAGDRYRLTLYDIPCSKPWRWWMWAVSCLSIGWR